MFPYQYPIQVIFHDIDAMQHVNNVVYATYLETARIEFLRETLGFTDLNETGVILGDMYIRYISPAVYPEQLIVNLGVSRFGNKSFDIVYQINAKTDGRTILTAKTTQVCFDYETQQSVVVSADMRQAINTFQNGWQFTS